MKKNKNRLGLLLIFFCLVIGLCACQKSDDANTSNSTEISNNKEPESTNTNNELSDEKDNNDLVDANSTISDSDIKFVHPIDFSKSKYSYRSNDWKNEAKCEYDTFELSEEDVQEFPQLANALKQFSNEKESQANEAFNTMRELMDASYEETGEELAESFYVTGFEDNVKRKVVRSDSVAFSIFCDCYSFYGGAHPYYSYSGYNYDSQTGKKLSCKDIVNDIDRLNEILYEKLMAEYGDDCALDEGTVKEYLNACKTGEYSYEWLLGYEGVDFYFNPYSLASFAAGMQLINIQFDEYPELFIDKYQKIPSNYIEPFCGYSDKYTDINGDGKKEKISAASRYMENDYNELYVYINIGDDSYTFNYIDSFNGNLYLIHLNGKCYIYNFVSGMGNSDIIQCYDLSDGTAKRVHRYVLAGAVNLGGQFSDRIEGEGTTEVIITESYNAKKVFVDPIDFYMSFSLDSLSTCDGIVKCSIGDDGIIIKKSDVFDVSRDWKLSDSDYYDPLVFKTKIALQMKKLDESMNVLEDVTIPEGTELTYIRTDGSTFADFKLQDGSEVRAVIKCKEYPQKICDIDIETALDGIIFAG